MAKIVLAGVFVFEIVLQIILNVIKKPKRLVTVVCGIVELVIASVMLTLDIISGDYIWIVWAIWVVGDVIVLTRKIMKDELAIQVLKGVIDCQQKIISFQQMAIEEQQLDLNNANKANTEHEH